MMFVVVVLSVSVSLVMMDFMFILFVVFRVWKVSMMFSIVFSSLR